MKKENKADHVTKSEMITTFKEFEEGPFKREINRLDEKIDRVGAKVDRVATAVVNIETRVTNIEKNMSTKEDLSHMENRLIDRMDFVFGKYRGVDLEQLAQAEQIRKLRETSQIHETRIAALEDLKS